MLIHKLIKRVTKGACFLAIGAILIYVYAFHIEPYSSITKKHKLGNESSDDQLRVVQLSDIQISKTYTAEDLESIIEKVNALKPDIFIFTGDLHENYAVYRSEKELINLLSTIEAPQGKFAIWGNRDYGGGGRMHYAKILNNSGFKLLQNSAASLTTTQNHTIWIGGMDDYLLGSPSITPLLGGLAEAADYRILLTHEPDTADFYTAYDIDLILSGHSHGGQVKLPFWKGITTSMADKYVSGFYELHNQYETRLYVNTGIGTSHYPVRLFVPPEITVFEIGLGQTGGIFESKL